MASMSGLAETSLDGWPHWRAPAAVNHAGSLRGGARCDWLGSVRFTPLENSSRRMLQDRAYCFGGHRASTVRDSHKMLVQDTLCGPSPPSGRISDRGAGRRERLRGAEGVRVRSTGCKGEPGNGMARPLGCASSRLSERVPLLVSKGLPAPFRGVQTRACLVIVC